MSTDVITPGEAVEKAIGALIDAQERLENIAGELRQAYHDAQVAAHDAQLAEAVAEAVEAAADESGPVTRAAAGAGRLEVGG